MHKRREVELAAGSIHRVADGIGGLGSLPGTVVAAIIIGLSDGIISVFFSPTLAKILATLLVGLVLVFRPQGLFGTRAA